MAPVPGPDLLWAAYESTLRSHPVLTEMATSGLLWGVGDAAAQRIEAMVGGGPAVALGVG